MQTCLSIIVALILSNLAVHAQRPLSVGTQAPLIRGYASDSSWVQLDSLLQNGPVVVVFYRGYWCPHCNRHLHSLQDSLALLQQQGISLLAITPEMPEFIERTRQRTGAQFKVIWDENHRIMDIYGVTFQLEAGKHRAYSLAGININRFSGNDDRALPVPATYFINRAGVITHVYFNEDYSQRVSVAEILNWAAEPNPR